MNLDNSLLLKTQKLTAQCVAMNSLENYILVYTKDNILRLYTIEIVGCKHVKIELVNFLSKGYYVSTSSANFTWVLDKKSLLTPRYILSSLFWLALLYKTYAFRLYKRSQYYRLSTVTSHSRTTLCASPACTFLTFLYIIDRNMIHGS